MYLAPSGVSMIFRRSPGNRLAPGKILGVCSHETSWSPKCCLNLVGLYTCLQLENQNLSKIERTKLLTLLYWSSGLSRCLSGKECTCQCRRTRFDPWVGKIPWRRKWQPTPVFLPGKVPWTEEPGRLQSMGCKESDTT